MRKTGKNEKNIVHEIHQGSRGQPDMKCSVPERVMRDIIAFSKEYNIQKVILFGSRAKGTHTDRSDIDIAVSGGNFDSFYWAVKERAHTLLSFDIVNFDSSASEQLKKEIEKDGVVIYEQD